MIGRLFKSVLVTAMLLSSGLMGTAQAADPGHPGTIAGTVDINCKAMIVYPHDKGTPVSCDGLATGTVVAHSTDGLVNKVCSVNLGFMTKAEWLALKAAELLGGPKKPKVNFNALADYHEGISAQGTLAATADANGAFAAYGLDVMKGVTCYTQGTFTYQRVGNVAVVTLPCDKGGTLCTTKNNDLRVGNGVKGGAKDPNQVWCKGPPQGGGVFTFTPKTVPVQGVPFQVMIKGTASIACA